MFGIIRANKLFLCISYKEFLFTFDEIPDDGLYDLSLIDIASGEKRWEPEDVFRCSFYLMAEECHPLMYDLELENPEMMPVD